MEAEKRRPLERLDTKRAYERIREWITALELAPGSVIDDGKLADDLGMGVVPVREALKLLAHENLVTITPRHGLYVADVNIPDLERLSEMRLALEGLSARLARSGPRPTTSRSWRHYAMSRPARPRTIPGA